MEHFPGFMKRPPNRVPSGRQNTEDVEGFYYTAADGSQAAFWECRSDRESAVHVHDFDEYMVVVAGEYTARLNGREVVLKPGDELFIPAGTAQSGKCRAGTRTVHFFGGKRI
jgi:mannose-6-phosphate isomerase-like protein (cupin superfamily)